MDRHTQEIRHRHRDADRAAMHALPYLYLSWYIISDIFMKGWHSLDIICP